MLKELNIRNFAIIDELQATFAGGLNIISGETGAVPDARPPGTLVGAGPAGPLSTERLELIREGVQECEARIFLEQTTKLAIGAIMVMGFTTSGYHSITPNSPAVSQTGRSTPSEAWAIKQLALEAIANIKAVKFGATETVYAAGVVNAKLPPTNAYQGKKTEEYTKCAYLDVRDMAQVVAQVDEHVKKSLPGRTLAFEVMTEYSAGKEPYAVLKIKVDRPFPMNRGPG